MRNNPILVVAIFSAIILTMDAYAWWGIKKIIPDLGRPVQRIIKILYWIIPLLIIPGLAIVLTFRDDIPGDRIMFYFHLISGTFIVFYIPKLIFIVFNLFDDLIFQIRKIITLRKHRINNPESKGHKITRRKLLNQVGIVFAGLPFLPLIYGIAHGRFDFTTATTTRG